MEDTNRFRLYSVLVHNGDVYGGHYYSFQRPTKEPDWFKYDDETVSRANIEQAIDLNFGGEQCNAQMYTKFNRTANACKFFHILSKKKRKLKQNYQSIDYCLIIQH